MKIRLFAAVTMALMLAACQQNPANSRNFTSKSGDFSINMPATPETEVKHVKSQSGVDINMTQYVATKDQAAYITIVVEYPESFGKPGLEEIILNGARDGAKKKGKLISERRLKLQGKYPGREVTVLTNGDKIAVRDRIYLVKNRMYQVIVSTAKDNIDNSANKAYLDSFQINE